MFLDVLPKSHPASLGEAGAYKPPPEYDRQSTTCFASCPITRSAYAIPSLPIAQQPAFSERVARNDKGCLLHMACYRARSTSYSHAPSNLCSQQGVILPASFRGKQRGDPPLKRFSVATASSMQMSIVAPVCPCGRCSVTAWPANTLTRECKRLQHPHLQIPYLSCSVPRHAVCVLGVHDLPRFALRHSRPHLSNCRHEVVLCDSNPIPL